MSHERTPADDDVGGDAGLTPARVQRWAEIAGDLVLATEVLPGPASIPDVEELRARHSSRRLRRRATLAVSSLTAAAALGGITMMMLSHRQAASPLSYVVEGTSTVEADTIEAPVARAAAGRPDIGPLSNTRIRFTEGTAIALSPGARLRIPIRTAVGAQVILDRGQASFTVVHRPAARWTVDAGPFTVDVTGTRFSVDWEAPAGRLTLDLDAGGVVVRGDAAGPGIAVHPGERLVASTNDGRVTVQPRETPTSPTSPTSRIGTSMGAMAAGATPSPAGDASGPSSSGAAIPAPPAPLSRPTLVARNAAPLPRRRQPAAARWDLAVASPQRASARANELRSDLQPPPVMAPSAPSLVMGGGGVFCAGDRASFGFEEGASAISIPQVYHLAFSGPRADRTHSWCGIGSARLDVGFDELGRRNFMGRLPHQSGQLVIRLAHLMDFTDKTVSLHVYIDGPIDARVSAQLYVIHHGKWVNGPLVDHLVPRRWWTISHTFRAENPLSVGPPYPPGGTSLVTDCDRIALVVYSTGGPRTWSGAIYVDDVGWK